MAPGITKQEYLGAVTLVAFSADGSLLYVGVGPTVFLYATCSGQLLGQQDVLKRGVLHGCDIVALPGSNAALETHGIPYAGAFFGQKRVACFQRLPQSPTQVQSLEDSGLTQLGKARVFADWIFDVQLLTADVSASKPLLAAVGLAHNLVQLWDPVANTVHRSVQCADRCILYALAFHGRSQANLIVASGTVFQQILLWDPITNNDGGSNNGEDNADAAVVPSQRLHAHDGVLFKLKWSSNARLLASVSDDRTVQLWSNAGKPTVEMLGDSRASSRAELLAGVYTPAFRSWGHSARLWDVSFWADGVATSSEDGLCKLWNLEGVCVATLQGHMGKHVWRVAVHPSQRLIATGGGDGAVKLWDATRQLMSSSTTSKDGDYCKAIQLQMEPEADAAVAKGKKKGGAASNSVRNLVVSPLDGGRTAFVASEHGQVFRLHLSDLTSRLFFTLPPPDAGSGVNQGAGRGGSLSTFSMDTSGRFLLLGDRMGRAYVVETSTGALVGFWEAHTHVRVIKIWWSMSDALFTTGADGTLCEWEPTVVEESDSVSVTMRLVASYQAPGRSSTSALVVVDRSSTRNLIGGDGRGNIFVFQRSLKTTKDKDGAETALLEPTVVLKSVHGRDHVTTLLLSEDSEDEGQTLLSGGHDGYICSFELQADVLGALSVQQIGRESVRGLSTVKELWWKRGGLKKQDLMVFGFHAAHAILHNFSAQYRVFSVECGGWRRPHALFIGPSTVDAAPSALPSHTFVFTPPVARKQQVEVRIHSTLLQASDDSNRCTTKSLSFGLCSLHDRHHGRMTTCVAFVGKEHVVTAAEDNSLLLHRREPQDNSQHMRWASVASGTAHTTTVRALTTFSYCNADGVDTHILISGGGKERLNVWQVRGERDVLRLVCGHENASATQDHRILGLATFAVGSGSPSATFRLVTACNSEGAIQLLLLDLQRETLVELGHCRSDSRKPILSCVGFQGTSNAVNNVAGLAVGSTDGLVTLWDLSALLEALDTRFQCALEMTMDEDEQLQALIRAMQSSGQYLAHDMGVNCLTLVSVASSERHGELDVALLSGGDDQNLVLRELRFPSCQVQLEARVVNASGSAIKALACADAEIVFAGGYDQRVSKWRVVRHDAGVELEWQGAAFSECADIAGLSVRRAPRFNSGAGAGAHEVVVVGQGLQMLQFQC